MHIIGGGKMKCVILAGGRGTRLREETEYIPKPMVLIGDKPMIWHIMKYYYHYGIDEFIICLGYKGDIIRDYFINYARNNTDCTISTRTGQIQFHDPHLEHWKVTLVDTGLDTQTGGRIKRIQHYIEGERFAATYGDGLTDVDFNQVLDYHIHNLLPPKKYQSTKFEAAYATLTGVLSKSRFGELEFGDTGTITSFQEKSNTSWINGGYFIFEPNVFDYIEGDDDPLEGGLLTKLTAMKKLMTYKHEGFWQCMDIYKETLMLNEMWNSNQVPWKVW